MATNKIKEFEYIYNKGVQKVFDKNNNEVKLGDVIDNGTKKIIVTSNVIEALKPFFSVSQFSIKYNFIQLV